MVATVQKRACVTCDSVDVELDIPTVCEGERGRRAKGVTIERIIGKGSNVERVDIVEGDETPRDGAEFKFRWERHVIGFVVRRGFLHSLLCDIASAIYTALSCIA
jgi:hypothetical protein